MGASCWERTAADLRAGSVPLAIWTLSPAATAAATRPVATAVLRTLGRHETTDPRVAAARRFSVIFVLVVVFSAFYVLVAV